MELRKKIYPRALIEFLARLRKYPAIVNAFREDEMVEVEQLCLWGEQLIFSNNFEIKKRRKRRFI